jgi:hypothetical protein
MKANNLHAIVTVRVTEELLETTTVEHFLNHHPTSGMLRNTNALLDNVGAELLHGQSADVASELTDDSVAETIVVEIKDVLYDLRGHQQLRSLIQYSLLT